MLELGGGAATGPNGAPGDLVKDVTEADFMAEVVDASKEVPVIVDFWAPWCGPCKTLGPALEAAVNAAGGKLRMAKVNVDQNQMIASQMRVQSIPAVFAFVNGQPVDGFMGAVGPAELKEFIDRVIAQSPAGDGGLEDAVSAADEMLDAGQFADAAQVFKAIIEESPDHVPAIAGLARAYVAAEELDNAKATLDAAPEDKRDDPALAAVRAQIELIEASADAGETGELRAKLEADPDDHATRLELANALIGAGDNEAAIEELLELFRRDREWNDGAAKAQLIKLFESLGPKDPLTGKGRRRLTSMIFA